jgi:hypothetical protein
MRGCEPISADPCSLHASRDAFGIWQVTWSSFHIWMNMDTKMVTTCWPHNGCLMLSYDDKHASLLVSRHCVNSGIHVPFVFHGCTIDALLAFLRRTPALMCPSMRAAACGHLHKGWPTAFGHLPACVASPMDECVWDGCANVMRMECERYANRTRTGCGVQKLYNFWIQTGSHVSALQWTYLGDALT